MREMVGPEAAGQITILPGGVCKALNIAVAKCLGMLRAKCKDLKEEDLLVSFDSGGEGEDLSFIVGMSHAAIMRNVKTDKVTGKSLIDFPVKATCSVSRATYEVTSDLFTD